MRELIPNFPCCNYYASRAYTKISRVPHKCIHLLCTLKIKNKNKINNNKKENFPPRGPTDPLSVRSLPSALRTSWLYIKNLTRKWHNFLHSIFKHILKNFKAENNHLLYLLIYLSLLSFHSFPTFQDSFCHPFPSVWRSSFRNSLRAVQL